MNIDEMLQGGNLQGLMAQAQEMQRKMQEAQENAHAIEVTGEAAGGMVRVVANGRLDVLSVAIDPIAIGEDREMLQDLIVAATNDALRKAREAVTAQLGPMAQMMKSAGLSL